MPFGDGTGPGGAGPQTGRKAGFCAGWRIPGFLNPLKRSRRNETVTGRNFSFFRSGGGQSFPGRERGSSLIQIAIPILGGALLGVWKNRDKIRQLLESKPLRKLIGTRNGGDQIAER